MSMRAWGKGSGSLYKRNQTQQGVRGVGGVTAGRCWGTHARQLALTIVFANSFTTDCTPMHLGGFASERIDFDWSIMMMRSARISVQSPSASSLLPGPVGEGVTTVFV